MTRPPAPHTRQAKPKTAHTITPCEWLFPHEQHNHVMIVRNRQVIRTCPGVEVTDELRAQ